MGSWHRANQHGLVFKVRLIRRRTAQQKLLGIGVAAVLVVGVVVDHFVVVPHQHPRVGGVGGLQDLADGIKIGRADAVLGMGGYVCFPGGLVAHWLKRPLVLVNADAGLLLSNRSLLKFADRVAFGFDGEAARSVPQGLVTGNPVRAEIEAIAPPAQRFAGRTGPLRVLVVGGSLGAQVLNETLPRALARLSAARCASAAI